MRLGVCGFLVCAAIVAGMLSGMPRHTVGGRRRTRWSTR